MGNFAASISYTWFSGSFLVDRAANLQVVAGMLLGLQPLLSQQRSVALDKNGCFRR